MEPPTDLIQSVSRALRILEVVGDAPGGLTAKAIARRAGLKPATTYHLLRTLAYEGYLTRAPNGDYQLGLNIADRFLDLRASLDRTPQVAAVLRGVMQATGHSAYLSRFVSGRIAIASVCEGPGSPHLEDLVPGFDEGAHATALGKSLLSTLGPRERRAYLAETGMRPFTSRTVDEPERLDAELRTPSDGVFVEVGQYRGAVSCAAVLVETDEPSDPWWAIGVCADSATFHRRRAQLVAQLRAAAGDLVPG